MEIAGISIRGILKAFAFIITLHSVPFKGRYLRLPAPLEDDKGYCFDVAEKNDLSWIEYN